MSIERAICRSICRNLEGTPGGLPEGLTSLLGPQIYNIDSDGLISSIYYTAGTTPTFLFDSDGMVRGYPQDKITLVDPDTGRAPRLVHNYLEVNSSDSEDLTVNWNTNYSTIVDAQNVTFDSVTTTSVIYLNLEPGVEHNGRSFNAAVDIEADGELEISLQKGSSVFSVITQKDCTTRKKLALTGTCSVAGTAGLFLYIRSHRHLAGNWATQATVHSVQVEECTGASNSAPSEYVSTADGGYALYATENGNSISSEELVEAVGNQLSGYGDWEFAYYPGSTNFIKKSYDFTIGAANWYVYPGNAYTEKTADLSLDGNFYYAHKNLTSGRTSRYMASATYPKVAAVQRWVGQITAKPAAADWMLLLVTNNTASKSGQCCFNVSTGVVGTAISNGGWTLVDAQMIENSDGSYTCYVVVDTDGLETNIRMGLRPIDSDGGFSLDLPSADMDMLYYSMAQFEKQRLPTPLIPTSGSAASRDSRSGLVPGKPFNDDSGVAVVRVRFTDDLASAPGGILFSSSFKSEFWLSCVVGDDIRTSDGTNTTYISSFIDSLNHPEWVFVCRWDSTSDSLQVLAREIGSSTWYESPVVSYDGSWRYLQGFLFYVALQKEYCSLAEILNKDIGAAGIKSRYSQARIG